MFTNKFHSKLVKQKYMKTFCSRCCVYYFKFSVHYVLQYYNKCTLLDQLNVNDKTIFFYNVKTYKYYTIELLCHLNLYRQSTVELYKHFADLKCPTIIALTLLSF